MSLFQVAVLACVILAFVLLAVNWLTYVVFTFAVLLLLLSGFLLHELTHFVILDTDVLVSTDAGFVTLETEAGGFRVLASAVCGPLVPFVVGLALWHYADWMLALPLLAHIMSLPFDILGAFGVCFSESCSS